MTFCFIIDIFPSSARLLIPISTNTCKLFSYNSKPIHALLVSKRRLIDLQKMPFRGLTNALLKSN